MRELDSDPSKWSDDDRAWAAQRPEQYPDAAPTLHGGDPSVISVMDTPQAGGTPDDDYQTWTVAELAKEGKARKGLVMPTGEDTKRKTPWIDALRDWDRRNPAT
jgi:hypothetical protein